MWRERSDDSDSVIERLACTQARWLVSLRLTLLDTTHANERTCARVPRVLRASSAIGRSVSLSRRSPARSARGPIETET